jgi:signal-transduction protein with cAMP-binding, CBS, and nucleotidyltransferase domain
LHQLSDDEREKVVEAFTLVSYSDGETVITQGETGSTFYIVKDGTMVVTKDGEKVAMLSSGDYFGEQALLTDDARAATVVAEKGVECFVLDRCAGLCLFVCLFVCLFPLFLTFSRLQGNVHSFTRPAQRDLPAR